MSRRNSIIRTIVMCGLLTGCKAVADDPTEPGTLYYYEYTWGFVNLTDEQLTDTDLFMQYKGREVWIGLAGFLGEHSSAEGATVGTPHRIPDLVTIKWRTPDKVFHHQEISLVNIVKDMNDFHGTIWLRYYDNIWHPLPRTTDEMDELLRQRKSNIPNER